MNDDIVCDSILVIKNNFIKIDTSLYRSQI